MFTAGDDHTSPPVVAVHKAGQVVGVPEQLLVAAASKGIDKKEAEVLKGVAAAAGLAGDRVKEIVKRANAISKQAGG